MKKPYETLQNACNETPQIFLRKKGVTFYF